MQKQKYLPYVVLSGIGLRETIQSRLSDGDTYGEDLAGRMAAYMLESKAKATNNKYFGHYKRFKSFCVSKGFSHNPADPIHVAIYLTYLLDSKVSFHVISAAFESILKWFYVMNDLPDPTLNNWVKSLLEAGKKMNSVPIKKKDTIKSKRKAMNSEMLKDLCDMFSNADDVLHVRDLTMILLGYAGFLRFNVISELKCNDIQFKEHYIVLKIRKSKTDVYRCGKEVLISKGTSSTCPQSMLQKYLYVTKQVVDSEKFLFRPVNRSKGKAKLLVADKKLSYTRARECIVAKLKLVAPDLNLGTHSLRASGATMVANVEDRNIN